MRYVIVLVALAIVAVPATVVKAQSGVRPLDNGEGVDAGQLAVTEMVDHGEQTIHVTGGRLQEGFTAQIRGSVHANGWIGYATDQDALNGACGQALERFSEATSRTWAEGYRVFLHGNPFSGGNCAVAAPPPAVAPAPAPAHVPTGCTADTYVRDLKTNETAPAGKFAVVEVVHNGARTIQIEAKCLTEPFTERIEGVVHFNGWWGYGSIHHAQEGACTLAAERRSEASLPGSWNQGYAVFGC